MKQVLRLISLMILTGPLAQAGEPHSTLSVHAVELRVYLAEVKNNLKFHSLREQGVWGDGAESIALEKKMNQLARAQILTD